MARKPRSVPFPDGIAERQVASRGPIARHASPLSVIVLGAVIAFGLSGAAGGRVAKPRVDAAALELRVEMPDVVRNGEVFESLVRVRAKRPIGKLVIGIEPGLWRELTINSTVPAAGDESYEGGLFRFAFAKLDAGDEFLFKVDGQVNPNLFGTNRGRIAAFDGKTPLAEVEATLRVLP